MATTYVRNPNTGEFELVGPGGATTDTTLSLPGKPADAAAVSVALSRYASKDTMDNKVDLPKNCSSPKEGQVLAFNADGSTYYGSPFTPSDEQAETYITAWLDEHPEATTTVQDGSITTEHLYGVNIETYNYFEYSDSYIVHGTGEIANASGYSVTRAYPVQAGSTVYARPIYRNYNSKINAAWYDIGGVFLSDASNENGQTSYYFSAIAPESAAFIRFTVQEEYYDKFSFGNPMVENIKMIISDEKLKQVVTEAMKDGAPDGSVSFSSLDFFTKNQYNKIDISKKGEMFLGDNSLQSKNSGSYIVHLKPGVTYRSNCGFERYIHFIFFDSENNIIGATYDKYNLTANTDVLPYYESLVENYKNHHLFQIPENTSITVLNYGYANASQEIFTYDNMECFVVESQEYDENRSFADVEWVCNSDDFKAAITSIKSEFIASALSGKTAIFMGDSYTVGMASMLESMCNGFGMVADNRGVVSSSICGDYSMSTGSGAGYRPMWRRTIELCEEYKAAATTDNVAVIVFMGGANDGFGIDTWIGSGISDTNTNHIYGAMHSILNNFRSTFPKAKIITVLQPSNFNRVVSDITDDETANTLGFTNLAALKVMDDYQYSNYSMFVKERAVEEVAKFYGTAIVDCCFNWYSVLNADDRATYWNEDKLHLSIAGYKNVTNHIKEKIIEIFS